MRLDITGISPSRTLRREPRRRAKRWTLGGVAVLAILVLPGDACAEDRAASDVLVLSGPASVAEGSTVRSLVVIEGPTRVEGVVQGDVFALGGEVEIAGRVGGSVLALGGAVRIAAGARVGGDVVAQRRPSVAEGASVGGAVRALIAEGSDPERTASHFTTWLAISVSALALAFLLAALTPRRTADAIYGAARSPLRALAVGVALVALVPVAGVTALTSVVGAPFGMALLLSIVPVAAAGYVASAWVLGRLVAEGDGVVSEWPALSWLLIGLALVRLMALVPGMHAVLTVVLSVFGVGAGALALARARRRGAPSVPVAARPITPALEPASPHEESREPSTVRVIADADRRPAMSLDRERTERAPRREERAAPPLPPAA